jgi:hypothetical protein
MAHDSAARHKLSCQIAPCELTSPKLLRFIETGREPTVAQRRIVKIGGEQRESGHRIHSDS